MRWTRLDHLSVGVMMEEESDEEEGTTFISLRKMVLLQNEKKRLCQKGYSKCKYSVPTQSIRTVLEPLLLNKTLVIQLYTKQ